MQFEYKQIINDRYEIINFIESGGTSEVYLAKDLKKNREIVLKVIKINDTEEQNKVLNELKIYYLISKQKQPSQYIMNLYDHFELGSLLTNNFYYVFVIEYIKGITLRKLLDQEHSLSYFKAIEYIRQIALGVMFLHNLTPSVIHRDLKPENCMINYARTDIKIIDLGASSALFLDKKDLTSYSAIDCTILYAPPTLLDLAQVQNELKNKKITKISDSQNVVKFFNPLFDIHSLGVMLYELIASVPPFVKVNEDESDASFLKNWKLYDFFPLSLLNPSIPKGIDNILIKCFASKRHSQFQYHNIQELIDDLNHVLDSKHPINQRSLIDYKKLNLKPGWDKKTFKQSVNQKIFLSKWFITLIVTFGIIVIIIISTLVGLKEKGLI